MLQHQCNYAHLPAGAFSGCTVALPGGYAGYEAAVHLARMARSRKKAFKEQNHGCLTRVLPVMWHRHYDATEGYPRQVEFSGVREDICLAGQSVLF